MPTILVKCNTMGKRLLLPRLSHVNTLSPLGNATVAVKVSEAYLRIGGKCWVSTGPNSVGTVMKWSELKPDHSSHPQPRLRMKRATPLHPHTHRNKFTFNLHVTTSKLAPWEGQNTHKHTHTHTHTHSHIISVRSHTPYHVTQMLHYTHSHF